MPLVKAGSRRGSATAPPLPEGGEAIADLTAADPAQRRMAAHSLARRPEAATALAARLGVEEEPGVREAILTALVRIGTADAAAGLVPCLGSEDAGLRNGAIESLNQMPPDAVMPQVEPLLADADSDLRLFAVQVVAGAVHPERLARLTRVIDADPQVNVCLAAADGLADMADPTVLPVLERLEARFPDEPMVAFAVGAARRRFREG
ncbi:HEAT repeat domain-containing protein [Azospirillum halopraeferens]|uniref:HEAT repeat domain-containing protein n=1 Tax=Azospirillum halopraeferens TaxID=34010 RepID=UPI000429C443|nr:HEAT repeat domain-containing protein [Azospirillum halopraeferens]